MAESDPPIRRNYPAYEEDFAAWIDAQAELLRQGRFGELDLPHLIDEVASVGRSQFSALISALELILLHMMKWDYQVERQGRSWRITINTQRRAVLRLLGENPSFKARLGQAVDDAYATVPPAVEDATSVPMERLPATCPFSWDEIMNRPHDLDPDRVWPN